jgi:hypothetical protein
MKLSSTKVTIALLSAILVVLVLQRIESGRAEEATRPLAHSVFFELKEPTPEAAASLIAASKKYLSGHPGTLYFAAGVIAGEFQREVNDRDFQVALHIIFKDKAAHDVYQSHERHQAFIAECSAAWKKVRVFDAYLGVVESTAPERRRGGERADAKEAEVRIPLPDPAFGFAGMIHGKVIERRDRGLVLEVEAIAEEWKHSKAPDSKSLVGKKVLVIRGDGDNARMVARFLRSLAPGETVTLDVAHKEGETLTVLELTEEQRAKVNASR